MANYNSQFGDSIFADILFGDIFNQRAAIKTWVEICPAESDWINKMVNPASWGAQALAEGNWSAMVIPDSEFVNQQIETNDWDKHPPSRFPLTKCNRS